ncbi:MAG: response regulator [Alphaproteobacteria bacterium]
MKILFVEEDVNLLGAIKHQFRKDYAIETATSGKDALFAVSSQSSFAVVVSGVPGTDGIKFLKAMGSTSPDTIRVMLTANAGPQTVVDAVNEANVFRLLTKPCRPDQIMATVDAALAQHRLANAKNVMLEKDPGRQRQDPDRHPVDECAGGAGTGQAGAGVGAKAAQDPGDECLADGVRGHAGPVGHGHASPGDPDRIGEWCGADRLAKGHRQQGSRSRV